LEILASHRVNAGPEFIAGIFAPRHLGFTPTKLLIVTRDLYRQLRIPSRAAR
jgi:hypothetical protein